MFRRRAEALHREVSSLLSPLKSDLELQLAINADGPPRRGSFEVSIALAPSDNVEDRSLIWTGLKNTPRAAKFPTPENIANDLKGYLKLVTKEEEKSEEEEIKAEESPESLDDKDEVKEEKVAATNKKGKRGRPKK